MKARCSRYGGTVLQQLSETSLHPRASEAELPQLINMEQHPGAYGAELAPRNKNVAGQRPAFTSKYFLPHVSVLRLVCCTKRLLLIGAS